uniref:AIG1-type G domain-containing protein n=1 Tax=Sinocyclocheilus rhinocerous TaxID=307959 RepID=A0A673K114_9TELE
MLIKCVCSLFVAGDAQHLSELRIVLMGYRAAGKSSAGNTILGREEFDLKTSAQCVRRHGEVADRHITVIEAPGWWRNYTVENSPDKLSRKNTLISHRFVFTEPLHEKHTLLFLIHACISSSLTTTPPSGTS